MNSIDRIKTQIELIKKQTDDFIEKIEISKWNVTPDIIETNMNWQIGHIILANYLHGIASISGANEKIREKLNVKDFIKFYGLKSNPSEHLNEKPKNEELKEIYNFIFELIWLELEKVNESDFNNETEIPNPGAKTKYEALTLLFKHQSWHNGQIAILNRVLNK
jgi:hypothetical protein